ncbi:MAG: hypothetical protein KAG66_17890 [Methylococcales bacterium]|nr:hypothetical protein [Methylococcales bacterium]
MSGKLDDLMGSVEDLSGSTDLFKKISDESTGLGKLLAKLPGMRTLIDKSRRREADQLLRQTVATQLGESRLQLGHVVEELGRDISLAIDFAAALGSADTRLMGLIGKIEAAPVGYSAAFDAIKTDEAKLAAIYDFDAGMLDHADLIQATVAALAKAVRDSGDIAAAIRELDKAEIDAGATFASRASLLSGGVTAQ